MTAPLQGGQFDSERVKGMFGGPRATKGRDGTGDMSRLSGATTYGGASLGDYWNLYPNIIGGLAGTPYTNIDTGSPMGTVVQPIEQAFYKGDRDAEVGGTSDGMSQGGTAAY